MRMLSLSCALGLLLVGGSVFADTPNLLTCKEYPFVVNGCHVADTTLAQPVAEDGIAYDSDFVVSYDFPCIGHSVQIGVRSGDSRAYFTQGTVNGTLQLAGWQELRTVDESPDRTARASFRPGCKMIIRSVDVVPSVNAVAVWAREAQGQAKILDLSSKLYGLAGDYVNLRNWDRDKLVMLKDKVDKLVVAQPANVHYKAMQTVIHDALDNAPSSISMPELSAAGETVRATLRKELEAEIAKGDAIVARFARWQRVADAMLANALEKAKQAAAS